MITLGLPDGRTITIDPNDITVAHIDAVILGVGTTLGKIPRRDYPQQMNGLSIE